MPDFGQIPPIIAYDIANESSYRINELRRIEPWIVLENLSSQSDKWRTDLIANVCNHRQMLFGRTFLEVDTFDNHYTLETSLSVSM